MMSFNGAKKMNLKKCLDEAFHDYVKTRMYGTIEIVKTALDYKDKKTLQEAKDLRFCADLKNDKVFIWDANMLHYEAATSIGIPYSASIKNKPFVIWGEATYTEQGIEYFGSSDLEVKIGEDLKDKDINMWVLKLSSFKAPTCYATIIGLEKAVKKIVAKAKRVKL